MALGSGWRRVVVGLLVLGCGGEPRAAAMPAAVATPVVSQQVAPPLSPAEPSAPALGPVDACVAAAGFTEAATDRAERFAGDVMAQLVASGSYQGERLDGAPGYTLTDWLSCLKTPGGAWALELAQARLSPQSDYDWRREWFVGNLRVGTVNCRTTSKSGALGATTSSC